jgi:spermidine synthase
MRTLARIEGRYGEILIVEELATGTRRYYEGGAFQSHALPNGESCFAYVHIMCELLRRKRRILLLGCGAGSLATMLSRRGAQVTLVDHNPTSFELAKEYFGLPTDVRCFQADYLDFLAFKAHEYDAIGIDVGNDTFDFREEFDGMTCRMIDRALAADGVAVINMMASHDVDPTADLIATLMTSPARSTWILDQMGLVERNAVIVASKGVKPRLDLDRFPEALHEELETWSVRTSRLKSDTVVRPFPALRRGPERE